MITVYFSAYSIDAPSQALRRVRGPIGNLHSVALLGPVVILKGGVFVQDVIVHFCVCRPCELIEAGILRHFVREEKGSHICFDAEDSLGAQLFHEDYHTNQGGSQSSTILVVTPCRWIVRYRGVQQAPIVIPCSPRQGLDMRVLLVPWKGGVLL